MFAGKHGKSRETCPHINGIIHETQWCCCPGALGVVIPGDAGGLVDSGGNRPFVMKWNGDEAGGAPAAPAAPALPNDNFAHPGAGISGVYEN